MIEQKINDSLKELEHVLKDIDSARRQVEKTVNAYDELNNTTSEFVSTLNTLTTQIKALISSIEIDYEKKVSSFEKDRKSIVDSANAAIIKLSDATVNFQRSLNNIESKLKYSLILNGLTLLALVAILFWVIK